MLHTLLLFVLIGSHGLGAAESFATAGAWVAASLPKFSRACSAALPDGRSLITFGATANYFSGRTTLTPAAPMLTPRAGHICATLRDGAVLVVGGEPTNSAEVFHPDANRWTPVGGAIATHPGGRAVLLSNGQVLITGGGTLEVYDPERRTFLQVRGTLSATRTRYALAALPDNRVVIAGGSDGGRVLDTIDIFDPERGAVYPVGRMLTPRANFTATTLPSGVVVFAGGTDGDRELASTEIFDPASASVTPGATLLKARQGHIALSLHGGKVILLAGGTSQGEPVDSAELRVADRDTFEPAPEAAADGPTVDTVAVAAVEPDGSVRNPKRFRVPASSAVAEPKRAAQPN